MSRSWCKGLVEAGPIRLVGSRETLGTSDLIYYLRYGVVSQTCPIGRKRCILPRFVKHKGIRNGKCSLIRC